MLNKLTQNKLAYFDLPIYYLSPRRVTKFLLSIIGLLFLGNIFERAITYWLNTKYNFDISPEYFHFDKESNFPSLYSGLALGFSSLLLAIVATFERATATKYAKDWKLLSFIFLYLAIDEVCQIHEQFNSLQKVIKAEGFLSFPWIIPASLLVIVFLIKFRKFIFSLPAKIKTLFILAGTVYVLGAIGVEIVGGYLADSYGLESIYYLIVSITEELMEMFGVVIFINALLIYIKTKFSKLNIALYFQDSRKKLLK